MNNFEGKYTDKQEDLRAYFKRNENNLINQLICRKIQRLMINILSKV